MGITRVHSGCVNGRRHITMVLRLIIVSICVATSFLHCVSFNPVASEEYFSIATAYFELGKYAEAERWFTKAKFDDKTRNASDYNLGRIAFETGHHEDAAVIFEKLISKDPDNLLLLRSAAYSWAKAGKAEKALVHYDRIQVLLPLGKDSSFNHSILLYSIERYAEAIGKLLPYLDSAPEDLDARLLLARCQTALDQPEALDSYAIYLAKKDDVLARYEYAGLCESSEFYALAVENYDTLIKALDGKPVADRKTGTPTLPVLRFAKARSLFLAGSDTELALNELGKALEAGYNDQVALDQLSTDDRIAVSDQILALIESITSKKTEATSEPKKESVPSVQAEKKTTP